MDVGLLIGRYGLWVVFLGSLLEGESVLVLAGFGAHRGYLDFLSVVAVAWLGAVMGDGFYFWLGRRHGPAVLARWPRRAAAVRRALHLVERHSGKVIVAMRFAWGLRTALPIAIGISGVSRVRFLMLNMLSAALWAPVVAGAGWLFGETLARHLGDLQRVEHWVLLTGVVIVLVIHGLRHWRQRIRS